jgi:hypothetical protein
VPLFLFLSFFFFVSVDFVRPASVQSNDLFRIPLQSTVPCESSCCDPSIQNSSTIPEAPSGGVLRLRFAVFPDLPPGAHPSALCGPGMSK